MTVIRHVTPVDMPAPIITDEDPLEDWCDKCLVSYGTRAGNPDPTIYGYWLDLHGPHIERRTP